MMQKSQRKLGYLFLAPNLIGFIVLTLIPVIWALVLSFHKWGGFGPMEFVGFKNYSRMFTNETFWISIKNNAIYSFVTVPASIGLGLFLAMLMNSKLKGIEFFRTVYFLPYITSMIAVSVVWSAFYHPSMGPINMFLKSIGVDSPPKWLSSSDWALLSVMIMSVWKGVGYNMVILLAGLQGVPKVLFEAAEIDGASKFAKFRYVTLPMLSPTLFFTSIMGIISSFKVFDQIYMMTEGGPGRATNVLVYYIYRESFQNNRFGYASAVSYVLFAIILVITLIQYHGQRKWVNY
jgi:multiple sugar transport system permease protein